ncbi:hypothetical protein [Mycobacterium sp. P7213]|uniref:hypothetical protein n=1 Tax=Mycobacterium sp. P7213 TaxID=2478465 RepID=UPI000F641BCC
MLIVLSGPSTVGKSHICRTAMSMGYGLIIPTTSRLKRAGEIDGADYEFVSREQFQDLIRRSTFCEWDYILGNYYGDRLDRVETAVSSDDIWFLDALAKIACRMIPRYRPRIHTALLRPGSPAEVERRLAERGYTGDDLVERRMHGRDEVVHEALLDQTISSAEIRDPVEIVKEVVAGARRRWESEGVVGI